MVRTCARVAAKRGMATTKSRRANRKRNVQVNRLGRTGKRPTADDTFLWRICHALDEPPRVLANKAGVPYADIEPLLDARHKVADLDSDETWWRIFEYVGKRTGELMAIRLELSRALQRDRTKRAMRAQRVNGRPRIAPPREGKKP